MKDFYTNEEICRKNTKCFFGQCHYEFDTVKNYWFGYVSFWSVCVIKHWDISGVHFNGKGVILVASFTYESDRSFCGY